MGESKASELAHNLQTTHELSIVNDSAKNTVAADDQKTNIVDYANWKETLRKMEM